jgi:antitoxin component YwqK of YwqJK toxin-antitoxin module
VLTELFGKRDIG